MDFCSYVITRGLSTERGPDVCSYKQKHDGPHDCLESAELLSVHILINFTKSSTV